MTSLHNSQNSFAMMTNYPVGSGFGDEDGDEDRYEDGYGSGNDIFSSLNVTNQHARKGISYDHKQLLKFLRRRRLERNFLRSPSE